MKSPLIVTGMICLLSISHFAQATVSPDRTRIIFNASNKSATVRLINQSKTEPYLAQSWIEDASGKKRVIIFRHYRRWNELNQTNRCKFV